MYLGLHSWHCRPFKNDYETFSSNKYAVRFIRRILKITIFNNYLTTNNPRKRSWVSIVKIKYYYHATCACFLGIFYIYVNRTSLRVVSTVFNVKCVYTFVKNIFHIRNSIFFVRGLRVIETTVFSSFRFVSFGFLNVVKKNNNDRISDINISNSRDDVRGIIFVILYAPRSACTAKAFTVGRFCKGDGEPRALWYRRRRRRRMRMTNARLWCV